MKSLDVAFLLTKMKINQWKSEEELADIQKQKLTSLLRHASTNVPHYKNLKGFVLRELTDFSNVPVTTKTDIIRDPISFISSLEDRKKLIANSTSGSSGMQVSVYISRSESAYGMALELHHMTECGLGPFDHQVKISHYQTPMNLFQKAGLFRRSYLDVQEDESEILTKLRSLRPSVLYSYPSFLLKLAKLDQPPHLKMIFTCGEVFSDQGRQIIERSFDCPVYDSYGSMETSWIAWECEKGGMHIHSDNVFVEVLDEENEPVKAGRLGSVVLTPLWQRAMPFIRYRLEDKVALGGRCVCGRGHKLIKSIEGRQDDLIRLPSGRTRSARSINLMDDLKSFKSYQIIQERPDYFIFRFVPSVSNLSGADKAEIIKRIKKGCLGEDISVEFDEVNHLHPENGKLRAVISKVRP